MTHEDFIFLTLGMVVFFIFMGIFAVVSDALEKRRPPLPRPDRRAVVGESHKPWM